MGGLVCNFATQLKFLAGYDDALDVSSIQNFDSNIILTVLSRSSLLTVSAVSLETF